jgi:metal-responsive CopG/Arc/MetJ family transcriptional regulator
MKTAISMSDALFQAADALAERLGVSRSQLIAQAVSRYVDEHDAKAVTRRLDAIYAGSGGQVDPALANAQARLLRDEDW